MISNSGCSMTVTEEYGIIAFSLSLFLEDDTGL